MNSNHREILSSSLFVNRTAIERKRTERSGEPFLLMQLDVIKARAGNRARMLKLIQAVLANTIRETDIIGWLPESSEMRVLFTGLSMAGKMSERTAILRRLEKSLSAQMSAEELKRITIDCHFFPEDGGSGRQGGSWNPLLSQNAEKNLGQQAMLIFKRLIDLTGASVLLMILMPLFLAIALAVKATSRGPLLFRQERVGQNGRPFIFFKFRSMYVNNDDREHREYVSRLIAGQAQAVLPRGGSQSVYKLANDSRITPLGKFLRRASLDELPQLFNVLLGDMALVGPRPPLPYELAICQPWHHRRLLVKPGMTGLWQVKGRSRVSFEEMVRMDLHYARTWSPWLDLKILLLTPGAVVRGAY